MALSSAVLAIAVAACVMAVCVVKWDPTTTKRLMPSFLTHSSVFQNTTTTESVRNTTSPVAPIPSASDFAAVREAYFAAKANSRDPHDEEVAAAFRENLSGARIVPLEIRVSTLGSRGLFTRQRVAKGQPVYEARRSGIFHTEAEWTRFLELLPTDDLRYDVVLWSYVLLLENDDDDGENQNEEDAGTFVVGLDLDEGSLMNHGVLTSLESSTSLLSLHGSHALSAGDANVQVGDDNYFVATRDIEAGEEVLCDYGTFHQSDHTLMWYKQSWDKFIGTK